MHKIIPYKSLIAEFLTLLLYNEESFYPHYYASLKLRVSQILLSYGHCYELNSQIERFCRTFHLLTPNVNIYKTHSYLAGIRFGHYRSTSKPNAKHIWHPKICSYTTNLEKAVRNKSKHPCKNFIHLASLDD